MIGLPLTVAGLRWLPALWLAFSGLLAGADEPPHHARRLIIMPKEGAGESDLKGLHRRHKFRLLRAHPAFGNLQVLEIPSGTSVPDAIRACRQEALVAFAEPDYTVMAHQLSDDPAVNNGAQWHLNNLGTAGGGNEAGIRAAEAWDLLHDAEEVIVALVDSGIRYTHEDLAANMWRNPGEIPGNGKDDDRNGWVDDVFGINAVGGNGDPMDTIGHGTHTAGIVGAVGNNGTGGSGVAWKVRLMACKFLDSAGEGSTSDAIRCMDYARTKGAKIINCSWGGTAASSALSSAIERLRQAGIVVVASSGNDGADNDTSPQYPANDSHDNVIAVAATTASDRLASFSNFGSTRVDLGAPGLAIYSTWASSDSSYSTQSGTSMSAPMVSGALALLRARFPSETPAQLIDRLLSTTDPIPALTGKTLSGGRLNLRRALTESLFADFTVSTSQGSPPLSVSFTNTTRGTVAELSWDFGDGMTSTEAAPVHVFENEGRFNVTLKVTGTHGVPSSKTRSIVSLGNYTHTPAGFSWVESAGFTRLPLADNGVSPPQTLPFPFLFYGQVFEHVYVGANGVIGFRNEDLDLRSNTTLPNSATPNGLICPYWDNLNPELGGEVSAGTIGAAPHRRFVISWNAVPMNLGGLPLTFQAILEEGSGNIVFQYLEVHPESIRAGGLGATVGLENESGSIGLRYLFNGAPRTLTNQQAIVFQPRFRPGLRVMPLTPITWSGPVGGPFLPSGSSITLENLGPSPLRWKALRTANWSMLSDESGLLDPSMKTEITLTPSDAARTFPAGNRLDTVEILNESNGIGNTRLPMTLSVQGVAGDLALAEDAQFAAAGFEGGPFSPASRIYTISNRGDALIDWSADVVEPWITLSMTRGALPPGESEAIVAKISPAALKLPAGSYRAVVQFNNRSSGKGGGQRAITLNVSIRPPPKLKIAYDGNGLHLAIQTKPDETVVVETSTDLSSWTPFQTGAADGEGSLSFEISPSSLGQRYYRAVVTR